MQMRNLTPYHKMLAPLRQHMENWEECRRSRAHGRPIASGFAILMLALVAISAFSFAADPAFSWTDANTQTGGVSGKLLPPAYSGSTGDWFRMAMYAILICLFANIVIFMLAKASKSPNAERFAVSEFYQVSASAVMILVLVAGINESFVLIDKTGIMPIGTTTTCYGAPMDIWKSGPSALMQCKIQEKIEYTEGLYVQAEAINKNVEVLTTLCIYFWSVQIYCGDWDAAMHAEMEKAHYLAHKTLPIGVSLHAQFSFVKYLANNMLSVFLPLGLLLRIVPLTRGIGGLLIAIAIGFFFVFPICYILLDPSTVRPNPADLLPGNNRALSPCFNSFSGAVGMITQMASVKKETAATPDASEVGKEVAKLQTEAFVIPLAALAVTLTFISTIAPLLGGEAGELMHFVAKVI